MSEAVKPKVKLSGTNGNVFALAGKVSGALRKAEMHNEAKEFTTKLSECGSYDKALQLMMRYVDVS